MPLKTWNGSSWVSSTGLKVWNGSSWVPAINGKVWDGSAWVQFLQLVSINNHTIDANAGPVPVEFPTPTANASITFNTSGTLTWAASLTGSVSGEFITLDTVSQSVPTASGTISNEWLLTGASSSYQIYVSRTYGFGGISGASFDTWTTINSNIVLWVPSNRSDNSDIFTVQIRDVETQTIQDTCTITLIAFSAGLV